MIYGLRRMIYLRCKHDIISVPIIREAYIIRISGFHREAISPRAAGFHPSARTDFVEKSTCFRKCFFLVVLNLMYDFD